MTLPPITAGTAGSPFMFGKESTAFGFASCGWFFQLIPFAIKDLTITDNTLSFTMLLGKANDSFKEEYPCVVCTSLPLRQGD